MRVNSLNFEESNCSAFEGKENVWLETVNAPTSIYGNPSFPFDVIALNGCVSGREGSGLFYAEIPCGVPGHAAFK